MRILISAYACEPGKGSEPEVGLRIALAAASKNDVWVVTRDNNLPSLHRFLEGHPLESRITLVGHDVDGVVRRLKKRGGLAGLTAYYDAWQRSVRDVVIRLDADVDFDVVHHATFASYWSRVGVAVVDKPMVWGPVGGGVRAPMGMLSMMGLRGTAGEFARGLMRPLVARAVGARATSRRAAAVLVQNRETARRLREARAVVLPNALVAARSTPRADPSDVGRGRIVHAARLVGWKGAALAILAIGREPLAGVALDIYGDGPQRERLQRLVERRQLADRVCLHGRVPREEVLAAIAAGAALLHPALHEEAGLVVTEALAAGTPVVGIDRGGPPMIARWWPDVPSRFVRPTTPARTAGALAQAVADVMGRRRPADPAPADDFERHLQRAYQIAADRLSGLPHRKSSRSRDKG